MSQAVYPGTFDPITLGHVNIVERGLKVFDKIIVACNAGNDKDPTHDIEARKTMLSRVFENEPRVEIDVFQGLLVDYLKDKNVLTILRGIRTVEDFEYEYQMMAANRMLAKDVETVFMLTEKAFGHLSSSLIKEIARLGGDISEMVPKPVLDVMSKK